MRYQSLKYDRRIVPTPRAHTNDRMQLPLLDLRILYASIREDILSTVTRGYDSQQFIMGPELTREQQHVTASIAERVA